MAAAELFANTPATTVSSGGTDAPVSGTQETWTVASSAEFPAASTGVTQFHVGDPDATSEMVAVTNVSGDTWTVTRGAESTTPVAHTAGFTVQQVVTAGVLGGFLQAANNLDDVASETTALANLGGLPLAGGTMSGPIAMGANKITGLANGSGAQDAAAFGQIPASLPPSGAAGGVLTGSYPNPGIITLNQNTTGTASAVSGTVAIANGGTGQGTQQGAMNSLAGGVTAGDYLRGDGTNVSLSVIHAADVPTLNQNTTGTASNITDTLDQVPAPAANVAMASHKLTGLANGSAATDSAAFGQIPVADATASDFQPIGVAAAGANGEWADSGHVHPYATAEPLATGEALFPRWAWTQQQPLTTSTIALTYWTACKTETIGHVKTITGGQAATGQTYANIGIFTIDGSGNLTLAASTGDLHTTLWTSTFNEYNTALTSSFSKVAGTRYAMGLLSVAGTVPSLYGQYVSFAGDAPILAGTSTSGTIPSTIGHASVSAGAYQIAYQAVITT